MADKDSTPNSSSENQTTNPDDGNYNSAPENDRSDIISIDDALARQVQESLSLAQKHHIFWETQPVGQFNKLGVSSLPEGPIERPTPMSEVKQEPYNLPVLYEWMTCDMGSTDIVH